MNDDVSIEDKLKELNDSIVFFEGSLEELNAEDPSKQYCVAAKGIYDNVLCKLVVPFTFEQMFKLSVKNKGFDGLVEFKMYMDNGSQYFPIPGVKIEGVPVVKLKEGCAK